MTKPTRQNRWQNNTLLGPDQITSGFPVKTTQTQMTENRFCDLPPLVNWEQIKAARPHTKLLKDREEKGK